MSHRAERSAGEHGAISDADQGDNIEKEVSCDVDAWFAGSYNLGTTGLLNETELGLLFFGRRLLG